MRVALIGGGVIGAGWAARLVLNGIDVTLCDPDPQAPRKVDEVLANAERAYRRLTMAPLPQPGALRFAAEVEEAVTGAGFVQESAPEREEVKIPLLARIDRACPPEVVVASSTSGLRPTRLQAEMRHPERFTVGHPFNPVYLLPLVEVCGGERTSEATKERAAAFYRGLGMHPLVLRREIDGFLADRLMEALWREALHLVSDDVATVEELDDAVRYGCGLRWAIVGTFLTYRIAGGEAGMRHFLAQFGPALKLPWTRLEAPELTDEVIEKIVAQSDAQAGGRSVRELERLRDDCLVGVMQALRAQDWGAGAVLAAYTERLYGLSHAGAAAREHDLSRPLRLHAATVPGDWIDYNGHMNESRYLQVFSDASDALLRLIGVDEDYLARGFSWFTVETHIRHLGEGHLGDRLEVATQVLAGDAKRLHIFQTIERPADGAVLATGEQLLLHVDARAGRVGPAEEPVAGRLARLAEAQSTLPRPEGAGRRVGERRG